MKPKSNYAVGSLILRYFGTITVWRCDKFGIGLLGRISASPYQCQQCNEVFMFSQEWERKKNKFSKAHRGRGGWLKIKLWGFVNRILSDEHSALSNTVRWLKSIWLVQKLHQRALKKKSIEFFTNFHGLSLLAGCTTVAERKEGMPRRRELDWISIPRIRATHDDYCYTTTPKLNSSQMVFPTNIGFAGTRPSDSRGDQKLRKTWKPFCFICMAPLKRSPFVCGDSKFWLGGKIEYVTLLLSD